MNQPHHCTTSRSCLRAGNNSTSRSETLVSGLTWMTKLSVAPVLRDTLNSMHLFAFQRVVLMSGLSLWWRRPSMLCRLLLKIMDCAATEQNVLINCCYFMERVVHKLRYVMENNCRNQLAVQINRITYYLVVVVG